jgi:hypothetical protein
MRFDTKIAVALRADLPVWQKLNVTAFTAGALAAADPAIVGEPYEDASGRHYLSMFRQPVLVFAGDAADLRRAYERAAERGIRMAIFTEALFSTNHDEANREAVKAVPSAELNLVGLALRGDRKEVDKILKGLALHA